MVCEHVRDIAVNTVGCIRNKTRNNGENWATIKICGCFCWQQAVKFWICMECSLIAWWSVCFNVWLWSYKWMKIWNCGDWLFSCSNSRQSLSPKCPQTKTERKTKWERNLKRPWSTRIVVSLKLLSDSRKFSVSTRAQNGSWKFFSCHSFSWILVPFYSNIWRQEDPHKLLVKFSPAKFLWVVSRSVRHSEYLKGK